LVSDSNSLMSKRKRKVKKRKARAPRKTASNLLEFELPWKKTWMAVRYQRRRQREPNYSFKEFILENGVHLAECYERFQLKLILWHGTTLPRAKSILREGFHCHKSIWMTENAQQAHNIALFQAKRWKAPPAILISIIDQSVYKEQTDYYLESPGVYVFQQQVPTDFVQYLLTADGLEFVGKK
jgi:hypothetical protein